jgi:hypothetical protein
MAPFFLLLVAAVAVAWVVSEFQDRRWLRLLLGLCTLVLVVGGVGVAVTIGERLNTNAWYGGASGELIDATVAALEKGRTEEVLAELKRLREQFQPTYENRARYDRLVKEYVARLEAGKGGDRAKD